MELARNEKEILKFLKKIKKATDKELVNLTGINIDGVRRGLYFLSEKGLVNIKISEHFYYRITDKGREAQKILPEEELLSYKDIRDIDKTRGDILYVIGKLKEKGYVQIKDNKIIFLKDLKGYAMMSFKNADEKALEGFSSELIEELLKRGYITKEKLLTINAEITEKGINYSFDQEAIVTLTREILEKKEWKNKSFKEHVIKYEDIPNFYSGNEHPLVVAQNKIRNIFLSMGFKEMTGNYIETSFWNFDALYQPQDHPSRELADTFFLPFSSNEVIDEQLLRNVKEEHEKGWKMKWSKEEALKCVLRTHTTVLSARTLYKNKRGKFFAIGRVFRNEAIDYKHLAEFHQVEGIIADENANFRHLLGILKEFFSKLGFDKIRFRPSFFPYTEPSLEIEVYFDKKKDWIEIGGAGIFREEVTRPLGCVYPVLAFGLSLERPLMMLIGLEDIREFYVNDFSIYEKQLQF